jgi:hypothetical protein
MAEGTTESGAAPAPAPGPSPQEPVSPYDPLWLLAPAMEMPHGLRIELRGVAEAHAATPELLQALGRVMEEIQSSERTQQAEALVNKPIIIPPICPHLTNCSKFKDPIGQCPQLRSCGEYSIETRPA